MFVISVHVHSIHLTSLSSDLISFYLICVLSGQLLTIIIFVSITWMIRLVSWWLCVEHNLLILTYLLTVIVLIVIHHSGAAEYALPNTELLILLFIILLENLEEKITLTNLLYSQYCTYNMYCMYGFNTY